MGAFIGRIIEGGTAVRRAPLRKTKEHRRNDARGVFRRAIVTRCNDVHRATGAVRASPSRRYGIAGILLI